HRADEAMPYFQAAIRLHPAHAEARSNLGLALRELGRFDEAIACFEELIRLNPNHVAGHDNLAHTLGHQGKYDVALARFRAALHIAPNSTRLLAGLSGLALHGHCELTEDEVRRIEASLGRVGMPVDEQARLHFALARVRDKAGAYDEAFAHYQR